jgi:hypothetical protein
MVGRLKRLLGKGLRQPYRDTRRGPLDAGPSIAYSRYSSGT